MILSGDVANRSTPDEYAAARSFLDKLGAEFGLSPEQFLIVPGNHDLNWDLAKKAYKLRERDECAGELVDGRFLYLGGGAVRLRDEALYFFLASQRSGSRTTSAPSARWRSRPPSVPQSGPPNSRQIVTVDPVTSAWYASGAATLPRASPATSEAPAANAAESGNSRNRTMTRL